ncbi:hypothetical protein DBV15_11971, partial [Temnothorax longispinosus]
VKCPLAAFNAAKSNKLQVGWFTARVQFLDSRPLQCFRCLEGSHVRAQCTSEVDRSSRCYRCGDAGHRARGCRAVSKCPVCADLGRPAEHRSGSKACSSAKSKKKPRSALGATRPRPPSTLGEEAMEIDAVPGPSNAPQPRIRSMEVANFPGLSRQPMKRTASVANANGELEERPLAQRRKKETRSAQVTSILSSQMLAIMPAPTSDLGREETMGEPAVANQMPQLPSPIPPEPPDNKGEATEIPERVGNPIEDPKEEEESEASEGTEL